MSQEREALKRTLITAAKIMAATAIGFLVFIGTFYGLTTLFDSMGLANGESGMMAMIVIWFIVAVGPALKWKYDKTLAEIRQRDEKIMKGLRG